MFISLNSRLDHLTERYLISEPNKLFKHSYLNAKRRLFTSVRNHALGINQEYIEEKSGDYLLFCEDQEKKGFKRPLGTGVLIFD